VSSFSLLRFSKPKTLQFDDHTYCLLSQLGGTVLARYSRFSSKEEISSCDDFNLTSQIWSRAGVRSSEKEGPFEDPRSLFLPKIDPGKLFLNRIGVDFSHFLKTFVK
jgi:hypothetical protein